MKNKILSMLLSVTMLSSMAVATVNAGEAEVKDVYNITFNKGTISSGTKSPSADTMLAWVSGEGYTRGFAVSNSLEGTSWSLQADPAPAADEADDKAIKVISTSSSNATNNYIGITTKSFNTSYKNVTDFLCGANGYTEFSFDFYSDFRTNLRLEIGRFLNQSGAEVDANRDLLHIYPAGNIILEKNEVAKIDATEYTNTWHNIKFVFKADNTYRAFLDNKPLIDWTKLTFADGVSIGGVRDFRIYNICVGGQTSTKYYDNLRYSFSDSAYPEPAAEFTTSVGDAIVSGEDVTDGSEATGFVATVTNTGDAEGSFEKINWAVTSGGVTGTTAVDATVTLAVDASMTCGLIVNNLFDAGATATVTVE